MSRYADQTQVSSDRSRAEIERTIQRYGADSFMYGWDGDCAIVEFRMKWTIRFRLPLPNRNDEAFTLTETGRERSESAALLAYEQAVRQRWRALALVIKAKLEAVESGITELEREFLAHIVLPDGRTMGDHIVPQLERALESGAAPPMLPQGRGR